MITLKVVTLPLSRTIDNRPTGDEDRSGDHGGDCGDQCHLVHAPRGTRKCRQSIRTRRATRGTPESASPRGCRGSRSSRHGRGRSRPPSTGLKIAPRSGGPPERQTSLASPSGSPCGSLETPVIPAPKPTRRNGGLSRPPDAAWPPLSARSLLASPPWTRSPGTSRPSGSRRRRASMPTSRCWLWGSFPVTPT